MSRSIFRASDCASGVVSQAARARANSAHAGAHRRVVAIVGMTGQCREADRAERAERHIATKTNSPCRGGGLPQQGGEERRVPRHFVINSDAMGRAVKRRVSLPGRPAHVRLRAPVCRPGGIHSQERGPKFAEIRAHSAMQGGSIHSLTVTLSRTRHHRVCCRAAHGSESVQRRMIHEPDLPFRGSGGAERSHARSDRRLKLASSCGAPFRGAPHDEA